MIEGLAASLLELAGEVVWALWDWVNSKIPR